MFVRNESGIVVQWPESEPLRPGCSIVDGNSAALAASVDVIASVDDSMSQESTHADASAAFASAAASVAVAASDLKPAAPAIPADAAPSSKK